MTLDLFDIFCLPWASSEKGSLTQDEVGARKERFMENPEHRNCETPFFSEKCVQCYNRRLEDVQALPEGLHPHHQVREPAVLRRRPGLRMDEGITAFETQSVVFTREIKIQSVYE